MTRSFRFAIETGILAAAATLVTMAVVYGFEAARWFDVAHVSVLDGEYLGVVSGRAAARDAMHPIILFVHFVYWLPWPLLGGVAGTRVMREEPPKSG